VTGRRRPGDQTARWQFEKNQPTTNQLPRQPVTPSTHAQARMRSVIPSPATVAPWDMMAVAMARLLHDGESVFLGVASPLPMVATLLAKRLQAPDLVSLNITGAVDAEPERLPTSTVDPALLQGTRSIVTLADLFDLSARGRLDVAFLSGVQIDRGGRINLSAVGSYERPAVRLPGGAGSALLMPTARRVILWRTRHDPRTFVERLDFVTAAGNVDRVVTPLGQFIRRNDTLDVEFLHPGVTPEAFRAATGFAVEVGIETPVTPAPTPEEVAALRLVDPEVVRRSEFR
jgi:glutaconate CoA-transferase subunit B